MERVHILTADFFSSLGPISNIPGYLQVSKILKYISNQLFFYYFTLAIIA